MGMRKFWKPTPHPLIGIRLSESGLIVLMLLLVGCSSSPPAESVPAVPPAPPGDLFAGVWTGTARSNRTGGEGGALVTFAKVDDRHYVMQFGGALEPTLAVPITIEYRPGETVFNGRMRAADLPYQITGKFRKDGSIFAYYTHGDDEGIVKLKRDTLP